MIFANVVKDGQVEWV